MREEVLTEYEVANNSEFQVDDDPSLLQLMVADMEASGAFYRPLCHWPGNLNGLLGRRWISGDSQNAGTACDSDQSPRRIHAYQ